MRVRRAGRVNLGTLIAGMLFIALGARHLVAGGSTAAPLWLLPALLIGLGVAVIAGVLTRTRR